MGVVTVLALALALSMDALAVAVGVGLQLRRVSGRQTFRLAFHFGLFQALMPVLGWAAGLTVVRRIERYDHWAAFGLLVLVGGRMVWNAFRPEEAKGDARDPTRGLNLVLLSVATSLDALAVGLTLSLLKVSVWWPAATIGLVCAGITAAGLQLGRLAARVAVLQRWADLLGGIVLLVIGARILHGHGVF
jgi:putative Mn2+ efflux pump MntP